MLTRSLRAGTATSMVSGKDSAGLTALAFRLLSIQFKEAVLVVASILKFRTPMGSRPCSGHVQALRGNDKRMQLVVIPAKAGTENVSRNPNLPNVHESNVSHLLWQGHLCPRDSLRIGMRNFTVS